MNSPKKLIGSEDKTQEFEIPTGIKSNVVPLTSAPAEKASSSANPDTEKIMKAAIKEIKKLLPFEKKLSDEVSNMALLKQELPLIISKCIEASLKKAETGNLSTKLEKTAGEIQQGLKSIQENHLLELKHDLKEIFKDKLTDMQQLGKEKHELKTEIEEKKAEKRRLEKEINKLKEELNDLEMLRKLEFPKS